MSETVFSASEFKAKCLGLLDDVSSQGKTLVITKHGRPVARVVPVVKPARSLRGAWKSKVRIHGDIVHFSTAEDWEANG